MHVLKLSQVQGDKFCAVVSTVPGLLAVAFIGWCLCYRLPFFFFFFFPFPPSLSFFPFGVGMYSTYISLLSYVLYYTILFDMMEMLVCVSYFLVYFGWWEIGNLFLYIYVYTS